MKFLKKLSNCLPQCKSKSLLVKIICVILVFMMLRFVIRIFFPNLEAQTCRKAHDTSGDQPVCTPEGPLAHGWVDSLRRWLEPKVPWGARGRSPEDYIPRWPDDRPRPDEL